MIKFKITPARVAEACDILQYLGLQAGDQKTALQVLPRFLLGEDGEYLVKIVYDADGDIEKIENIKEAFLMLTAITPKRSERLTIELMEAVKAIVNPPSGRDSNKPTPTA